MKRKHIDTKLANTIRQLRVIRNYNQEFVAEEVGVAVSTYTRMEGGKITIPFTMVKILAGLYNLTIDELVNFQDNKSEKTKVSTPSIKDTGYVSSHLKSVAITVELDGSDAYFKTAIKKLELIQETLKKNPL